MAELSLKGVRVNNLKNIDLTIPRDKLVVFSGMSGSGKSSLAFDTIYAEGHRRFVESLSSYARMFIGQLDKPDLDSVEGLSPAISIDLLALHPPFTEPLTDMLALLSTFLASPTISKVNLSTSPSVTSRIL